MQQSFLGKLDVSSDAKVRDADALIKQQGQLEQRIADSQAINTQAISELATSVETKLMAAEQMKQQVSLRTGSVIGNGCL